jgi:hypothetical protein
MKIVFNSLKNLFRFVEIARTYKVFKMNIEASKEKYILYFVEDDINVIQLEDILNTYRMNK